MTADDGRPWLRTAEKACAICGRIFVYRVALRPPEPPPDHCGLLACRAHHDWGHEEWAGRARMASARRAAGVPLDGLDRHALTQEAQS